MGAKLGVFLLFTALAAGQASAPHFAVISLRPQPPGYLMKTGKVGDPGPVFPGGKYIDPQATLVTLLRFAYPEFVPRDRRAGLPDWANHRSAKSPFYSLDAEAAPGSSPTLAQMRLMMRSLLATRFRLKFHVESKSLQVYLLQIRPGGIKNITPSAASEHFVRPRIALDGGGIEARGASIADLADFLAAIFQRPVLDRTGLAGTYNMTVAPGFDHGRAPIFAVRDTLARLGLRLKEANNVAVSVMVVDHVERPKPNS